MPRWKWPEHSLRNAIRSAASQAAFAMRSLLAAVFVTVAEGEGVAAGVNVRDAEGVSVIVGGGQTPLRLRRGPEVGVAVGNASTVGVVV